MSRSFSPQGGGGKPPGNFWNTPTLAAILVLILAGPDFFDQVTRWLWPFIIDRWGDDIGPLAFFCAWAVLIPATFTLLRGGLNSSLGFLAIWIVDKFFI
nr:hypothetical protein [uncultured Cohaesibacter sp.]